MTDKEFSYTVAQVIIKHPGAKLKTNADYRNLVKRTLFNEMLGARYEELSQLANPTFIQANAGLDGFMGGLDQFSVSVVAKPDNWKKDLSRYGQK